MKKLSIYITLFLLAVTAAYAQQDVKAKAILNQVSKKYNAYRSVKADFTFTADNPQANTKITQHAVLVAQPKTAKFKVMLFAPGSKASLEQEIICDGKTQWTYLKAAKEVQVNNAGKSDDGLNPARIFTMYEHGYKYLYTGEQKFGGRI